MEQTQKYTAKNPSTDLRKAFKSFLHVSTNLLKKGKNAKEVTKQDNLRHNNPEAFENRYSVLYTINGQYHHVGCSSQKQAQSALSTLMTDANRIPVGIYDGNTDLFEWEIIGQYFHSRDTTIDQHRRMEEILTISRALRRRDSSWQPGYLQKPGFFA